MPESIEQEYSLEKLEDAVLAEVSTLDASPQTALLKIAKSQLDLVRSGITSPMLVLAHYYDLFQIADDISDYEDYAEYEILKRCLCDAIVNYSRVLTLQLELITKKTKDVFKENSKSLLQSVVYTSGTIVAKFGSKALGVVARRSGTLFDKTMESAEVIPDANAVGASSPNDDVTEVTENTSNSGKKNEVVAFAKTSAKTAIAAKLAAVEAVAEGGQQLLEEVSSSTSIEKCKQEIKNIIDKGVEVAFAALDQREAKDNFFKTLDQLTRKLDDCHNIIGTDKRIAEMIRNYSNWMQDYEMANDKNLFSSFFASVFVRPHATFEKAQREAIAAKFDPPPEVPSNPILKKDSVNICRDLRSKVEMVGGPIANLCAIGIDLLSKPMPNAKDTLEYIKRLAGVVSNVAETPDSLQKNDILRLAAKTLSHLGKMLSDQMKGIQPAEGVHSRVSAIGLATVKDCISLKTGDAAWHGFDECVSQIQFYAQEYREIKIKKAKASDSYQKCEIDDKTFFDLFDSIRPIASKVGSQSELADILLPIAKKQYDGECQAAQKTYESECQKAEENFKRECKSKDVSEEKVSALKTKLFVSGGLSLGCVALIANIDPGFIKVLGYIVLIGSGITFIAALFNTGLLSTWSQLVDAKSSAISAAESAKSQRLAEAQSKLAGYEDIASRLKSQGLQS